MKTHLSIIFICAALYYIGSLVFSAGYIGESYGLLILAYFIGGSYIISLVVEWSVKRENRTS